MLLRYRHNLLTDAARGCLWDDLEERLLALPDTHDSGFTSWTEGQYQNSMGFQAVTRLGAIACMIKHHDKFPLEQTRRHAVACLRSAIAAFSGTAAAVVRVASACAVQIGAACAASLRRPHAGS
jgi:hypothetical protein